MMVYVKMVKELVLCGMKEDKAVGLVAKAYSVDFKALHILVHLEQSDV